MPERSTSRSIVAVAFGNLAAPLAGFATAPLLARALGVDGRGEVAAGTSLLLLFTAVGMLGIAEATTYFVAARISRPGAVLWRAVMYLCVSGLLLTGVTYVLAPAIAGDDSELIALIRIVGLATTPTLLLGAVRGLAQGLHRWELVNAEKYITALLRVAPLVYLFLTSTMTPLNAVLVLAWAPVFGGFAYLGLLHGSRPMPPLPDARSSGLLFYGLTVWIGSVSGVLLTRLDQTLLTPLAGVYELGLYVTAVNLSDLVLITHAALGQVLFSADARDRNTERVYLGSRVSVLVTLLLGIAIALPSRLWMTLLFGDGFLPAIPALLILLLANLIGVPGSVAGTVTSARGRPALRSVAIFVAALMNLTLLLTLAPPLGATGAAIATLAGSACASGMNLWFARRTFGLRIQDFCVPRASDVRAIVEIIHQLRKKR